MSSSFLQSSSTRPPYTSPPFDPATPPPPPPKNPRAAQFASHDSPLPPRPPPPPNPSNSYPTSQQLQPQTSQPLPPDPSAHWIPDILLDKQTSALAPLLSSPPLLSALAQTHPSVNPSPLPPHLSSTAELATHLQTLHARLLSLRRDTQQHLLQLHSMERNWRERQKQMDAILDPWSAKALYRRLGAAEREAEELSRGLEESFLEGEGKAGERELGEFVRRYMEARGVVEKRRAWRERWDEGRVWGWR